MSQPIAHYYVAKNALTQAAPELMQTYEPYVGFGSFGPDLFYLTSQAEYADMIHADGSLDTFCVMLDMVKNNWNTDSGAAGKQLGFALGFYAHVITDCVFHPYVYRLSGDYWAVPKPSQLARFEKKHKEFEAVIDHHLLEEVVHPSLMGSFDVDCGSSLDTAVSELLHGSLNSVYGAKLGPSFQTTPPGARHHLIQVAYSRFHRTVPTLYGVQNVLYRIDEIIDSAASLFQVSTDQFDLSPQPWPPGGLSGNILHSFSELYDMSVRAVSNIVGPVYEYLGSDSNEARVFFSSSGGLHLNQNWNLDTGMPAMWNMRGDLFAQEDSRYEVGVNEILLPMYQQLG